MPPSDRPDPPGPSRVDVQHLGVLVVLHCVYGGMLAVIAPVPVFYAAIGLVVMTSQGQEIAARLHVSIELVRLATTAFITLLLGLALVQLAWAGAQFYVARCLAQRRHRVACLVLAAINCAAVPLGTAMGIYTIVVLTQPGMAGAFSGLSAGPATIR